MVFIETGSQRFELAENRGVAAQEPDDEHCHEYDDQGQSYDDGVDGRHELNSRHGAVWFAVELSLRVVVPQLSNNWYGGTQVTTLQVTGPEHEMCVLHCPYRNRAQHACLLSQVPVSGQLQLQAMHELLQKLPQPLVHVQRGWQSM
jgi:hypothetical protein